MAHSPRSSRPNGNWRSDLRDDERNFPAGWPGIGMVEAGGQHIRGFRCGLDYAFIHVAYRAWMRSVLSG